MEDDKALIERAKRQFEVNGAPWTDRTEAAIRNVVTPLVMDIEALTLGSAQVRILRVLVKGAIADTERLAVLAPIDAPGWLNAQKAREALGKILDKLSLAYADNGGPY